MRFLVVLLLVLQVNSLQADEIFNLIKIPNLEVYKIDNNQGLKYLNSKQNFIIGVKNNIKCEKANKTNLANTFSIIERNLLIEIGCLSVCYFVSQFIGACIIHRG